MKKLSSNKIKKSYKINKNTVKILKINKINFIKMNNFLLFYKKIYIVEFKYLITILSNYKNLTY